MKLMRGPSSSVESFPPLGEDDPPGGNAAGGLPPPEDVFALFEGGRITGELCAPLCGGGSTGSGIRNAGTAAASAGAAGTMFGSELEDDALADIDRLF